MPALFIPNPKGIAELANECDFSAIAGEVAEEAKAIAPVGTGRYRDSIHPDGDYVIAGNKTVYYAWMLEFGTVDTPAFATLTTAAIHRGLELSQIASGYGHERDLPTD